jgi:hypothetical protein
MFFDLQSDRGNLDNLVAIGIGIFSAQFFPATWTSFWVVVGDTLTLLNWIQQATMTLMTTLPSSLFSALAFFLTLGGAGGVGMRVTGMSWMMCG